MSYSLLTIDDFPLAIDKEYRKAIIGLYHIAFVKNNYDIVLSIDDKTSIQNAISFYELMIKKGIKLYPIKLKNGIKDIDITKADALKEILGLPNELNDKIDFNKDIISQLTFVDDIRNLKIYSYKNMYDKLKMKWFTDDFKCFLLKKGIFFLQDETIPFINDERYNPPILINEEIISNDIRKLITDVTSLKLYFDYDLDININLNELKKYDKFSFIERVDYFINNIYIEKIADLNPSFKFKNNYKKLLKIYFSCIINHLYDEYLTEVLKIENNKKSIMTEVKINDYFVISSLNTEVYSSDKINYYLPSCNKKLLENLYDQNKYLKNPIKIFRSLKLPSIIYEDFLKNFKKNPTNPFSLFKYLDIDILDNYKSIKRGLNYYNFLPRNPLHKEAYFLRELKKEGIFFSNYDEKFPKLNSLLNITISQKNTTNLLSNILNKKSKFSNIPFICFKNIAPLGYDLNSLYNLLINLDKVSNDKALYFFFTNLENTTLKDVILKLSSAYNIEIDEKKYWHFFGFILSLPYLMCESSFLKHAIIKNDKFVISIIEDYNSKEETYEPALPYKYVSYSRLAYSFRLNYDSIPYFCSCQKKAIENAINFYAAQYLNSKNAIKFSNKSNETNCIEKNKFILENINLPQYVVNRLNLKKEIIPQLHYKNHLCHLCNNAEPIYFEENNITSKYKPNTIYETYIHSIGCENNIFTNTVIKNDEFIQNIENNLSTFNSEPIITYSFENTPNILKPYFNLDGLETAALLINFFPIGIGYNDFDSALLQLATLSKKEIEQLFFKYNHSTHFYLKQNVNIFPQLKYTYDIISLAYKIELAKKRIPYLDEQICLNIDYAPKLPLPYVFLGKVFNAYGSDESGDNFYFCTCDKETIINSLNFINRKIGIFLDKNQKLHNITIMSLVGLPFVAIKKYAHLNTIDEIINSFEFKDDICRRCKNINHSAYSNPFLKALPYKDEMEADYSFAKNTLAKESIFILDDVDLKHIKYDPKHIYSLNSSYDPLIFPMYIKEKSENDKPNLLYVFSMMSKDILENYIYEFTTVNKDKQINLINAGKLILNNFENDKSLIYRLLKGFSEPFNEISFKTIINRNISSIARNESKITDETYQGILGFITFLLEKFLSEVALKEKRIGRN